MNFSTDVEKSKNEPQLQKEIEILKLSSPLKTLTLKKLWCNEAKKA